MKTQKFGTPRVEFSWLLEADDYSRKNHKVTLDTAEGESQLVKAIKLCIDQGYEIRIGTDGCCLIMEANQADDDYTDASYQYVDDEHEVVELVRLPDNTTVLAESDQEAEELLAEFLRKHPKWKKSELGHWYEEHDDPLPSDFTKPVFKPSAATSKKKQTAAVGPIEAEDYLE